MVNVLKNPRFGIILLLGFSSGLPFLLIGGTLSYWLAEGGASLKAIGLFALVRVPYNLKFLWAPVIDQLRLPLLTRRFGRRRSWGLLIQILLTGALLMLAASRPAAHLPLAALLAVLIGFLSASQDIVIDALRVEMLAPDDQGLGAATAVLGYRLGMLVSGAGALLVAYYATWPAAYGAMAALIGIGMLGMALAPNTDEQGHTSSRRAFGEWARHAVIAPLVNLLRHRRWPVIFLFILFYKLGEVLALAMTSPLYVSLGYTKAEVATITKLFGFIATIVGSLAGGLLIKRAGIWFGLLIGGILQIVGQLAFFLLATNSHDLGLLTFSIGLENFSGGLGTAALVAYLSSLCAREYTATQYALLSALSAVALNIFTAPAGYLAAGVGWPLYYALTPLAALPGLALLVWIRPPKSGLEYRQ